MRPALLGIRHVALSVEDLEGAERFWTEVLGYTVEWRPDADNVYLTAGVDNLALHRRTGAPGGALDHVGLAVRSEADVDAWAAFLAERGVLLEAPPRTHRDGSRSLYFRDTSGTLVQIIFHPPLCG